MSQSFGPWASLLRYVVCKVFYLDFEDIVAERSVDVEHATLNRWVARLSPIDRD